MSDKTSIEWTDATWNPVTGCNQVSSGCAFCYAKRLHDRRFKAWSEGRWPTAPEQYRVPFETVQCHPDRLDIPMGWKKTRKIFVNSMSDLFHSSVHWEFLDQVFATMFTCNSHTFQVLTKRAVNMRHYMSCRATPARIAARCFRDYVERLGDKYDGVLVENDFRIEVESDWPPRNIWLGVSVENQAKADERIPALLNTPAAVRFLSIEPLLGAIDLSQFLIYSSGDLHQVIVGGESGPGARPMHPDWARSLRDQCVSAGVPFFFKQWGNWVEPSELDVEPPWDKPELIEAADKERDDLYMANVGKLKAGRLLDGREWNEYPKSWSPVYLYEARAALANYRGDK